MRKYWKLFTFVGVEFLVVITVILLILFAGRRTFTVTFDLNGGTFISGNLTQTVRYGSSATPPEVTKEGSFLLEWSESYNQVTKDLVVYAIWEYETSYGIQFEVVGNSNYCLISGSYENISGDVYIGSFYNGMKVLGIKDGAFKNRTRITGIYLLDGLVSIGSEAFYGCTNLKTIEIPSTVEKIGSNVLKNCNKLEKMSVPFIGNVLGENTKNHFGYFFGALNYLYNGQYVPESLKEVYISGHADIPEKAFYNCINIKNIILSKKIEKIQANAFRNCEGLEHLTFEDGLLGIHDTAFANCLNLKTVVLPNSLLRIGNAAFANCTSLNKITIGSELNDIEINAFQNCINLVDIVVSSKNENFYVQDNILIGKKNNENIKYVIDGTKYVDNFDSVSGIVIGPGFIRPDKGDLIVDGLIKDPTLGSDEEE